MQYHRSAPDELMEIGFTKVGFLNRGEVADAIRLIGSLHLDEKAGFYASNMHAPRAAATSISRALMDLAGPAMKRCLPDSRAVKAVALAKSGGGHNWVNVHQDWDFVDERTYRGLSVWCPLIDTGIHDGLLHVLPGSHRWLDNRRGSGVFPMPFDQHSQLLVEHGVGNEMVAGEAIIYDNAALHYSPPNVGGRHRLVLAIIAIPRQAKVIHLHSEDGRTAEVFETDPLSFTARPFGARPLGSPMAALSLPEKFVDDAQMQHMLSGLGPVATGQLMSKTTGVSTLRR